MANYWAITIGINQYRHLQPLMHAQNDALFVHRFLTDTSNLPSTHCVLLSDLATSVGQQAVYPDKPALSEWIQTITQQVGPDDILWFFFSGYGVQLEGADYLMPIDGEPEDISATGLAVSNLIDTLKQLPTQNILLALDINRSQGSFSGQAIGTQVIQLAQDAQVPTLLSCEPEQYSHETLGVRHGLFTAAFLEALQQKCTTIGQISDYVSKRLPELCEHHWRPIQNLVSLVPEAQQTATVVPENSLVTDVSSVAVTESSSTQILSGSAGSTTNGAVAQSAGGEKVLARTGGTLLASRAETDSARSGYDQGDSTRFDGDSEDLNPYDSGNGVNSSAIVHVEKTPGSSINGSKLRNWGLLILALLMGAVLLRPLVKTAVENLRDSDTTTAASPEANLTTEENAAVDAQTAAPSATTPETGEVDEAATENAEAPTATEAQTETAANGSAAQSPDASAETADSTEEETETTAAAGNDQEQADAQTLLAQANANLAQRQYSEAITTLRQVPPSQRDSQFSETLAKARAGAADARQFNASVLTEARTFIQSTQASQFSEMIAKARMIKPGEPYYEEAQQDIRGWSQTILDIARGRATGGDLDGAIAAADIMPSDNPEMYQKAQDAITRWQQRQRSREIIAEAQRIPKSGQASSYQQGIVKLREVPIDHPEYETAQRLADDWSDRIFSIAQARAAQGRRRAAVQAAILVPAGTTAYEPTQQAIRRWQREE